jgi:pyruvate/2-oxoglutarate/acetoin dehydrogenase E1 component
MKYFEELKKSMEWLSEKPDTLFLGQAVEYDGTAITNTLKNIPKEKKLEMPVNEDMQVGISLGMGLNGTVPVSIFPRWNFLLLGANQLINHIDKIKK